MFNYDNLVRRFVPSVKRFQILYPKRQEVGRMTDYMDRHIEFELLLTYKGWVAGFLQPDSWYEDRGGIRPTDEEAFHSALEDDLRTAVGTVNLEMFHIESWDFSSLYLQRWEFEHLDNDLGTTRIERELAKHRDEIFEYDNNSPPEEMRQKYQHLFSVDAE